MDAAILNMMCCCRMVTERRWAWPGLADAIDGMTALNGSHCQAVWLALRRLTLT